MQVDERSYRGLGFSVRFGFSGEGMGDCAVGSVWRFRAFQHLWYLGFRVCAVSIQDFGFKKSLLLDMETCCVRGVMGLKEGVAPSCKVGVSLGLRSSKKLNIFPSGQPSRATTPGTHGSQIAALLAQLIQILCRNLLSFIVTLIEQADGAPSSKSSLNFAQTCHSATCDQENL